MGKKQTRQSRRTAARKERQERARVAFIRAGGRARTMLGAPLDVPPVKQLDGRSLDMMVGLLKAQGRG